MPLQDILTGARDKYNDFMSGAERFSEGVNTRARRMKQAMFPDEPAPSTEGRDAAAAQDDIERAKMMKERMKQGR
jgi:hypothetical protein